MGFNICKYMASTDLVMLILVAPSVSSSGYGAGCTLNSKRNRFLSGCAYCSGFSQLHTQIRILEGATRTWRGAARRNWVGVCEYCEGTEAEEDETKEVFSTLTAAGADSKTNRQLRVRNPVPKVGSDRPI
eukprot:5268325-Pleurochrysis_carterae.AAC.2